MSTNLSNATPAPDADETPALAASEATSNHTVKLIYWLVGAFLLRLFLIRFPYMFTLDVNTFRAWGDAIIKNGPTNFYANTWSDYPPLFMYFLWVWGLIQMPFTHSSVMSVQWAKLPACICDIINAGLIYYLLKGRVAIRSAFRTAVFYAFNPIVLFVSAIWGQVDAVVTMAMLLVMSAVLGNRLILSAFLAACAILVKPQGVFMTPVVFFALWWRNKPSRWPLAVLTGVVTAWVIVLPATWHKLGGTVAIYKSWMLPALIAQPFYWLWQQMGSTGNNYPYSTVNAFNIWMLPPPNEAWKPDSRLLFGFQHYTWGIFLTCCCLLLVGIYLYRNRNVQGVFQYFLAAAITLVGFYMLSTRMHERYIFPAIAFLALAQACNRRLTWIYWAFTATSMLSISYIFFFYNDTSAWVEGVKQMMNDGKMLGSLKLSGMVLLSLVNVWLFGELLSFAFVPGEMVPVIAENRLVHQLRTLKATVVSQAITRIDFVIPLVVASAFFVVGLYRLGIPNEQIFDEVYHARTAMEYIVGISPYEWTHPPLAKLLAATGVLMFHGQFDLASKTWTEHQAFAWRFMSLVFGSLTIPVVYGLTRSMFENRIIATSTILLLSLDGVFFVQSRVAMTNIYEVCFVSVAALGTWLYVKYDRERYLFLLAFGMGCALASRWTSLYDWGLTGLFLVYHMWRVKLPQWKQLTLARTAANDTLETLPTAENDTALWWQKIWRDFRVADKRAMARYVFMIALCLGVIPVFIYALTYIPYVLQGPGDWRIKLFSWNWDRGWGRVLTWQRDMWNYHAHLVATHPYSSPWWSWPIMLRPTWYYFHDWKTSAIIPVMDLRSQVVDFFNVLNGNTPPRIGISGVWAIGNAFIWWAAIPALAYTGFLAYRDRLTSLGLITLLGLGLWVMWGVQPRSLLYMHYMFESIPFACMALSYVFYQMWFGESTPSPAFVDPLEKPLDPEAPPAFDPPLLSRKVLRSLVVTHGVLIVAWFIFYYPLLAAIPIPWTFYNWHIWFGRAWI